MENERHWPDPPPYSFELKRTSCKSGKKKKEEETAQTHSLKGEKNENS